LLYTSVQEVAIMLTHLRVSVIGSGGGSRCCLIEQLLEALGIVKDTRLLFVLALLNLLNAAGDHDACPASPSSRCLRSHLMCHRLHHVLGRHLLYMIR
jgi:hypothetical protein